MNIDQEILGIAGAVVSVAASVYLAGVRIGKLELKVNTIWDFIMRRAMSEAMQRGLGVMNSPLVISEEAKA